MEDLKTTIFQAKLCIWNRTKNSAKTLTLKGAKHKNLQKSLYKVRLLELYQVGTYQNLLAQINTL